MRRLRCKLLDILALVSVLLCVAAAGLWKRSCSIDDHFGRLQITSTNTQVVEHRTGLFSGDERLTLGWGIIADTPADYVLRSFGTQNPPNIDRVGWSTGPSLSWFHEAHAEDFFAGFGTAKAFGGKTWNDAGRDFVTIPYWYLVTLLALLPIWRVMVITGVPLGRRPFRLFMLALGFMLLLGTSVLLLHGPAGLFVVLAIVALYGCPRSSKYMRARERIERGLCSRCGYDLRASPDRCPECGQAKMLAPANA